MKGTPPSNQDRLRLIADVTDGDIATLHEAITNPNLRACFDDEPISVQQELAALFKMGPIAVAAMANSPERLALTGVEAIRDLIQFLLVAFPEYDEEYVTQGKVV